MKKIYYLESCSTCKRVLSTLKPSSEVILQELKSNPICEKELAYIYGLSKSYQALFNKRSQLYRLRKLNKQVLSESDYKALILEHYTFLARPIVVANSHIFIGSSQSSVNAAKQALMNP